MVPDSLPKDSER